MEKTLTIKVNSDSCGNVVLINRKTQESMWLGKYSKEQAKKLSSILGSENNVVVNQIGCEVNWPVEEEKNLTVEELDSICSTLNCHLKNFKNDN